MKNSDMPAMPLIDDKISTYDTEIYYGMSKRETIAMHALSHVLDKYNPYESGDFDSSNYEETANHAVGLADALLKELDKDK